MLKISTIIDRAFYGFFDKHKLKYSTNKTWITISYFKVIYSVDHAPNLTYQGWDYVT